MADEDYLSGLGAMFQGNQGGGQGGGFMDTLGSNRNALISLGLGLMSGTRQDPYGNAMRGYSTGAGLDETARYRRAQMAQTAMQRAQAQANTDRAFAEQKRQFDVGRTPAPSIISKENAYGEQEFYWAHPGTGTLKRITPEDAQKLNQQGVPVSDAGAARGIPAAVGASPGLPTSTATDETAIPTTATLAQQQPARSPLPPNVNPRKYIETYSEQAGKNQAQFEEAAKSGSKVFGLIDSLEKKVDDPKFAEASGPTVGWAGQQPIWNPARLAYEYGSKAAGAPGQEAKGHMATVVSDAQAINSELQRFYLHNQGQVTVQEREAINQILGDIPGSRSIKEAQLKLNNLKGILAAVSQRNGYVIPQSQGGDEGKWQTLPNGDKIRIKQ